MKPRWMSATGRLVAVAVARLVRLFEILGKAVTVGGSRVGKRRSGTTYLCPASVVQALQLGLPVLESLPGGKNTDAPVFLEGHASGQEIESKGTHRHD